MSVNIPCSVLECLVTEHYYFYDLFTIIFYDFWLNFSDYWNLIKCPINYSRMAASDSKAPIRSVKRVQFGILSADECVSISMYLAFNIYQRVISHRAFAAMSRTFCFFTFVIVTTWNKTFKPFMARLMKWLMNWHSCA